MLLCGAGAKTGEIPMFPSSLKDSEKTNSCMGSIPNLKVHLLVHDSTHIRKYALFHEFPPVPKHIQLQILPPNSEELSGRIQNIQRLIMLLVSQVGGHPKMAPHLKSSASITTPLILPGCANIRRSSQLLSAPETSKVLVVSSGTIDSLDSCNTPKSAVKTSGTSCTWRRR